MPTLFFFNTFRVSWIFLLIRENGERHGVYPDKIALIEETDLLEDILEKAKPIINTVEVSKNMLEQVVCLLYFI